MARDRRERQGRMEERERAERQARFVYIGVGTVLALAAIVIVVGVYIVSYMPPRSHVVTVADSSYNTRDVSKRAIYWALFGGRADADDIARPTVELIVDEEVLRRSASDRVDTVTADDIEEILLLNLGLIPSSDPQGPDSNNVVDIEALKVKHQVEPKEFADQVKDLVLNTGMNRQQYEAMIEAELYRERLEDSFLAEIGTSGPHIKLQRIRVTDRLAADAALKELEAGVDFGELADELSIATEDGAGGKLVGWQVPQLLESNVLTALDGMVRGEWSIAIEGAGGFFEIYLLVDSWGHRDYDDVGLEEMVDQRVEVWIAQAASLLVIDRDLSLDEEKWINEKVAEDISARLGG